MAIIKCCCFELRCQINFSKQWIFSGSPATQQKQNTLISAYTFYNQTTLIILILPTTWSPRPRTIWKTCKRIVWNRSLQKIDGNNNLQNLRQYLSGPTSCNTSQYFFCFNWKVKRRLQDTCVRKISSHFRCCCPHLHQWMLGGTKEFGNQTYSHCPQPTEWQLVAAAVSQSPPPPSLSAAPADLPPKLGDHLQRVLVPPTKSVHNKRDEHNTLCLTPVVALSHLERVLDCTISIHYLQPLKNEKIC